MSYKNLDATEIKFIKICYSIAGEAEWSMQLKLSVYVKMFINFG